MYLLFLTPCELGTQIYFTDKETEAQRNEITYPGVSGFELKTMSLHTMCVLSLATYYEPM